MKRFTAYLLLLATLAAVLGGCRSSSQGFILRYDISGPVENLDPQFATDSTARMIIGNLYEGLVLQEPNGGIVPGAAESWTVSADGLTYTFTLREGVCWSDGTPLTSADFLFTFQRLFNKDSPSPHAASYSCIKNGEQVLSGALDFSALGISAPNSRTVTFTLEYASPFFLELLAATPAVPCNQQAFQEARGRYGLEPSFVHSNGPFRLERWNNESVIQIRQSDTYVSQLPALATGVNFYIGRNDPVQQFLSGKSDLVIAPPEQIAYFESKDANLLHFDKTTWCIVFNQKDTTLGNPLIRQGLAHTIDKADLQNSTDSHLTATSLLVPPAILLGDQSYRELAGDQTPTPFDVQRGAYLFHLGLDSLEIDKLPPITFLVPEEDEHRQYMEDLQQNWQKHLGAYIHLEPAPASTIQQQLRSGNYQMLLMPFSPATGTVESLLGTFSSSSGQNYTGYHNPRYDAILANAAGDTSAQEAAAEYFQAETLLLSDVVVLPVYYETTTYAVADKISGVQIAPYAGHICFKYAEKA